MTSSPDATKGETMTTSSAQDHFAHCIQVFGGIPASSRRLNIDERAIRRFINGDLPISDRLMGDTAKALRLLVAEATAAQTAITALVGSETSEPQTKPV